MSHTRRRRSAGGRKRSDSGDTFNPTLVKEARLARKRQAKVLLVIGPVSGQEESRLHRRCTAATSGAFLRFVKIPFTWFGGPEFIDAAGGVDIEYLYLQAGIPLTELDKPIGETPHDWVALIRTRLESEFGFRFSDVVGVVVRRYQGLLNDFRNDIIPSKDDLVFLLEE